jgi:hypothetical protein
MTTQAYRELIAVFERVGYPLSIVRAVASEGLTLAEAINREYPRGAST